MSSDLDFRAKHVDVRAVPGDGFTFTVELADLGFLATPTAVATFGAITATSSVAFNVTSKVVTITVTLSSAQTTSLGTTAAAWTLVVTPSGGAARTFVGGTYQGDTNPSRSTPRAAHRVVPYDTIGTLTITGGVTNEYVLSGSGTYTPGGTDVPIADGGTGASTAATARTNLEVERKQTFNVKDYGAIGDGATDDSTAIQNAINAPGSTGGIVFFPRGTYLIGSVLLRSNIDLVGEHATLKGNDGTLQGMLRNPLAWSATAYIDNISIEGFTFDGANLARAAIFLYRSTNVRIRRNTIRGTIENGCYLAHFVTDCLVENNTITMQTDEPIGAFAKSVGIECASSLTGGAAGGADTSETVELTAPPTDLNEKNTIRNNRINYGTHAVSLSGARRCHVEGNHAYRQSHRGIIASAGAYDNVIRHNWCIDAQSTAGIHLSYQSNRNLVDGNVVITTRSGIERSGINVYYGCYDNEIVNNYVEGAGVAGIRLAVGCQRNKVANNRIYNCVNGIRLVNLLPSTNQGIDADYPNSGYRTPQSCPPLADNQVEGNLIRGCTTGIHVDQRTDVDLLSGQINVLRTMVVGNKVIDATTGVRIGIADTGGVSGGYRDNNDFVNCTTKWSSTANAAFRGPTWTDVREYGATGDGVTDDTAEINDAITAASTGDIVYVPRGTYMVNAGTGLTGGIQMTKAGITLRLHREAILKCIATASGSYNVIAVKAADCTIEGGQIIGDGTSHTGVDLEHGHGIYVTTGGDRCKIRDITISLCWGDGIYVRGTDLVDVRLDRVRCTDNRRNGVSITKSVRTVVADCLFDSTGVTQYTAPGAGIDWEPNNGDSVLDGLMTGCITKNNKGPGVSIGGVSVSTTEVRVVGHVSSGDCTLGASALGATAFYLSSNCTAEIADVTIKNSGYHGVTAVTSAVCSLTNVRAQGAGRYGFFLNGAQTLLGCTSKNSAGTGFYLDTNGTGTKLVSCVSDGSGQSAAGQAFDIYATGVRMTDCAAKAHGTNVANSYVIRTGATGAFLFHCRSEAAGTSGHYVDQTAVAVAFPKPGVTLPVSVTGSRAGNAALASMLTGLAGIGLITDSTTA